VGDRATDRFENLFAAHVQLVVAVDRAGADEHVDAFAAGGLERVGRGLNVAAGGAGEAADDRAIDLARDRLDRLEVAGRGGGEAGLDDVDAQIGQRAGHAQLGGFRHRKARRLFAVAQRGVEDANPVVDHDADPEIGEVKTLWTPIRRRS